MIKVAMMKTLRVREMMSRDVITVAVGTSVEDAARSLTLHHVTGAPVLEHGRIVGVVSQTDLVTPRVQDRTHTVGDVMTRVVYAVQPGDPAASAVRLMAQEEVHRCIVVDDRGQLAGIVTAMDVMRALARGDFHPRNQLDHDFHADPASAVEYVDLTSFGG